MYNAAARSIKLSRCTWRVDRRQTGLESRTWSTAGDCEVTTVWRYINSIIIVIIVIIIIIIIIIKLMSMTAVIV